MKPPLTGLVYWSLVYPLKDKLKARIPIPATLMDIDTDALVVAVGSGTPFKLLVLHSEPDGLIHIKLWECTRRLKEVFSEKVMSDLVTDSLNKIVKIL